MPKSTILIGSVSSPTLELSKNVGKPVGNYRWAVSGRIADASDMVSLLCTGVHLTLAHVKDGEGLTVDDFRFDDLDFHFLFPFLFFVFLSIADFSDLSILNKCFFQQLQSSYTTSQCSPQHGQTSWSSCSPLICSQQHSEKAKISLISFCIFVFLFFPYFLYRHYTD